jgi:UDP-N-acetylglucosamine--N-acetylmuramyl-(pentapeptide) pyrophosphoryl-undecaprenol N-acetylglucosamine transferase
MIKKVLLIGGGTGGHIFPLRNLIDELVKKGAEVELIVSDSDLDKKIVAENFTNLPVHFFQAGKIRRYLSWKNFTDPFVIMKSCWKALQLLKEIHPDVIFFKGGFVGFPFLVAAKAIPILAPTLFHVEPNFLAPFSEALTFLSKPEESPLILHIISPAVNCAIYIPC